jgi:hypothetical protein
MIYLRMILIFDIYQFMELVMNEIILFHNLTLHILSYIDILMQMIQIFYSPSNYKLYFYLIIFMNSTILTLFASFRPLIYKTLFMIFCLQKEYLKLKKLSSKM